VKVKRQCSCFNDAGVFSSMLLCAEMGGDGSGERASSEGGIGVGIGIGIGRAVVVVTAVVRR
jgi:hypothetical protein